MGIYETIPDLKSEHFKIREVYNDDCKDLLKVYSDLFALPFFNSDNCDGDNFYYNTEEKMRSVLDFWKYAYDNRWFARIAIVEKKSNEVIGTYEICTRVSDDEFNHMGILRLDVRSDYEKTGLLYELFSLITPHIEELLGCKGVITKGAIYAIERIKALEMAGYSKSERLLVGKNGIKYDGYYKKNL